MTPANRQLLVLVNELDLTHLHEIVLFHALVLVLIAQFVDVRLVSKHNHPVSSERSQFLRRIHTLEEDLFLLGSIGVVFPLIIQSSWFSDTLRWSVHPLLHLLAIPLCLLPCFSVWSRVRRIDVTAIDVLDWLTSPPSVPLFVLISF